MKVGGHGICSFDAPRQTIPGLGGKLLPRTERAGEGDAGGMGAKLEPQIECGMETMARRVPTFAIKDPEP